MNQFLTGQHLEDAIYSIIWEAKETLLIVSPYIKLDAYFKALFDKHEGNPNVHLLVVFGKNERRVHKSLRKRDFDYFRKFPNVSIVYVPMLHAKYYGNEEQGIVTSINLYDYSFKNNIEYGILMDRMQTGWFSKPSEEDADSAAWNTSLEIADNHEVVLIKRPVFEEQVKLFGNDKQYLHSKTLFDATAKYYDHLGKGKKITERLSDFPDELSAEEVNQVMPTRSDVESNRSYDNYLGTIREEGRIKFDFGRLEGN